LNPTDKAISAVIGWHEEKDGYLDAGLYNPFIRNIRNKKHWDKIFEVEQWHITNFIEPFLIKWGYMGNLNRFHKGWQGRLLPILSGKIGKKLVEFNDLDLLITHENQLRDSKEKIVECFEELKPALGPTATGKLLHLLYPSFFPLWDAKIRRDTKKAYKKNPDVKIHIDTETGDFYYDFMNIQREFTKKYKETLKKCGKRWYDKSILRMSDIYFWTLSNRARSCIEY